jgi:lipoyl(octanoyl) transferase
VERFEVMRRQEEGPYRVYHYLNPAYQRSDGTTSATPVAMLDSAASAASTSSSTSAGGVNEDWRSKICEWSYQVIDHFDYDREIVAVSLSYLDRYLCVKPVNKRQFQLVAMTTLYLACKLYDHTKIRMSALIELSRGYFTEEHITAMEESILTKLGWMVHPPTPLTFTRHLVLLLPPNACIPSVWHDMMEVTKFLTELAVIDYFFAPKKKSCVGLAALLTAMDGVDEHRLSGESRRIFMRNVYEQSGIDCHSEEVQECYQRLRQMYYEGGVYQRQQEEDASAQMEQKRDAERIASVSPVSVTNPSVNSYPPAPQQQQQQYHYSNPNPKP